MRMRSKHRARRMRQVTLKFPGVTEGDPRYALEEFALAVELLATGRGSALDRLRRASLELHTVAVGDMPPELRDEHERLRADLAALGLTATGAAAPKGRGDLPEPEELAERVRSLERRLREGAPKAR